MARSAYGVAIPMSEIIKFKEFFILTVCFSVLSALGMTLIIGHDFYHARKVSEILTMILLLSLFNYVYLIPYYLFFGIFRIKKIYEKWILFSIPFYIVFFEYYYFGHVDSPTEEEIWYGYIQYFKLLIIYICCILFSKWIVDYWKGMKNGKHHQS